MEPFKRVYLIVTDHGDPSVGIFPASWSVEAPFYADESDKDFVEWFRKEISAIYAEAAEGLLTADYDFELQNQLD